MNYATVCSGVEAPSLAWHGLGWSPVWFSEIENFPAAVLKHHHSNVPNLGDMTMLHENETYKNESIDLLCGGTPCQSFSFAGLRKGLDDERGNLALHFIRILGEKRPTWFVWENVPGVLSSTGGRDFATILGGFTGRNIATPRNGWGNAGIVEGIPDAYGIAWATLDAQYFGVPQRRRRIFVVGRLGDWHSPAAVLFDTACLSGHPAPRRETREGAAGRIAPCVGSGGKSAGSVTQQDAENGALLYGLDAEMNPFQDGQMGPLLKGSPTGGGTSPIVFGWQNSEYQGDGCGEICPTLDKSKTPAVAFDLQQITSPINRSNPQIGDPCMTLAKGSIPAVFKPCIGRNGRGNVDNLAYPLTTRADGDTGQCYFENKVVRRFTPTECERLQGMPDNYTRIPYRNAAPENCPDGPRYRAIGNSMAVPVMRWIGERIDFVHKLTAL